MVFSVCFLLGWRAVSWSWDGEGSYWCLYPGWTVAKSQEMCCRNGPQVRKLCFTVTYLLAILLILKNVLEENSISLWIHYHELVENGRYFCYPSLVYCRQSVWTSMILLSHTFFFYSLFQVRTVRRGCLRCFSKTERTSWTGTKQLEKQF